MRNRILILCLAAGLGRALALNPIHEASYDLLPRGNYANSGAFQLGGIFHAHDEAVGVPVSLNFRATPRLELGGGLKTSWGDVPDNFNYLVLGAKYQIPGATSVQADFLIGVSSSSGKGFAITAHHRFGYSQRFYSRLQGRLGFMDALVNNDAFMAMEVGFYPTLNVVRPLSLEMGFITSSQTGEFDENFALDFQPALLVHLGRESVVETAVAIGLAGNHKEELAVKVALIYAF